MPRKLDDNDVIEIRRRLHAGDISVTELMRMYERNRLSIYNCAKGYTFKHLNERHPPVDAIEYRREGQKVTDEDHADIVQRYDTGRETQQEIADSYGVDITYICRIINEQRLLT